MLLTTIFFPKMHTISQQSKYRRLKMHGPGSESTVYTTYTDYAGAGPGAGYYGGGYYGPPSPPPPHPHHVPRYTRSHSKYRHQPQYRSVQYKMSQNDPNWSPFSWEMRFSIDYMISEISSSNKMTITPPRMRQCAETGDGT